MTEFITLFAVSRDDLQIDKYMYLDNSLSQKYA